MSFDRKMVLVNNQVLAQSQVPLRHSIPKNNRSTISAQLNNNLMSLKNNVTFKVVKPDKSSVKKLTKAQLLAQHTENLKALQIQQQEASKNVALLLNSEDNDVDSFQDDDVLRSYLNQIETSKIAINNNNQEPAEIDEVLTYSDEEIIDDDMETETLEEIENFEAEASYKNKEKLSPSMKNDTEWRVAMLNKMVALEESNSQLNRKLDQLLGIVEPIIQQITMDSLAEIPKQLPFQYVEDLLAFETATPAQFNEMVLYFKTLRQGTALESANTILQTAIDSKEYITPYITTYGRGKHFKTGLPALVKSKLAQAIKDITAVSEKIIRGRSWLIRKHREHHT